MPNRAYRWLLAAATALLAAQGCTRTAVPPDLVSTPVAPAWHEVSLPLPAGAAGRPAPRDATACAGRWYVVGTIISADGGTRPAAWTSRDGRTWSALRPTARTPYGQVAVLYAAGCRDGQLAAIGAQSGGAHGNPRVTQWYLRADGVLDEVPAGLDLYGGEDAVNVGRIAGGPAGWLIAGNRVFGAAVWLSADATGFRLVDRAPGLASDASVTTLAADAVAYRGGWIVVGSGRRTGQVGSDPLAWRSADGWRWARMAVGGTAGDRYRVLQRVTGDGDRLVAVGVDGDRFGTWTLRDGRWRPAGRFGRLAGGTAVQQAQGLTAAGGRVWAAVTDGRGFGVWVSPDGGRTWQSVHTPIALPAGGADRTMTVGGTGAGLLLVADDGRAGRVWLADASAG